MKFDCEASVCRLVCTHRLISDTAPSLSDSMGKEPRATQQAQVGRLLHRAAFALLALHFCYIVLLRGGGDGRDTGGAPQERAAAAARGGGRGRAVGQGSLAPFGVASVPGSSAAESSRRPLDPHEMCSWETAQDVSALGGPAAPAASQHEPSHLFN